jgi:hypothetical protein
MSLNFIKPILKSRIGKIKQLPPMHQTSPFARMVPNSPPRFTKLRKIINDKPIMIIPTISEDILFFFLVRLILNLSNPEGKILKTEKIGVY